MISQKNHAWLRYCIPAGVFDISYRYLFYLPTYTLSQYCSCVLYFCRKKQPVVFLPNSNDGKKCEPSGAMSSFGYLSFVLSLINAAVNAANNVNNNQVSVFTSLVLVMY